MNDSHSHLNILIVDDDPCVREALEMLLQFEGHAVALADSGAQALSLFRTRKFDLIVTDYLMPLMRGDELAATIKRLSPHQVVIMLTAFSPQFEAAPGNAFDFLLSKPFELENLRDVISKCGALPRA